MRQKGVVVVLLSRADARDLTKAKGKAELQEDGA